MIDLNQDAVRIQNDGAFSQIKNVVIDHTGLAYYNDKDNVLATRICKRLSDSGIPDCQSYLNHISGPDGCDELDALTDELTVGETFFFRYSEQYDALRELVFPDILHRNRHVRRLRVWSAGCSNGAEAYSIAILLRRAFGSQLRGWDVTIVGTDINRAYLNQANKGRYGDWTLRNLPQDVRDGCFDQEDGHWILKPIYRDGVTFQYHNLITHALPSMAQNLAGFDVILCRNVMIYFEPEVIGKLLKRVEYCLNEGGWLLVGHAETMTQLNRLFLPVGVPGATVYRKRQAGVPPHNGVAAPPSPAEDVAHLLSPIRTREARASTAKATLARIDEAASRQIAMPMSTARNGRTLPVPETLASVNIETVLKLANEGDLDEAAKLCSDLLVRMPRNSTLHFYNGVIQSQLDNPQQAEQSLLRAVELKGEPFALAHYHLGLLRRSLRPRQARVDFSAALEAVADHDDTEPLECGDGMCVADLVEIVDLQLDLMSKP